MLHTYPKWLRSLENKLRYQKEPKSRVVQTDTCHKLKFFSAVMLSLAPYWLCEQRSTWCTMNPHWRLSELFVSVFPILVTSDYILTFEEETCCNFIAWFLDLCEFFFVVFFLRFLLISKYWKNWLAVHNYSKWISQR